MGHSSDLGQRLRQAREAAGMSSRKASRVLPKGLAVSHVTLGNYETGRSQPSLEMVAALADIYARPINWFLQQGPTLTDVRYRNRKSKVGVRDIARFEAIAQQWLEAYRRLDDWLGTRRRKKLHGIHRDDPAETAHQLREKLKLAEQEPITSVIDILEVAGVRVIEVATDLAIDGMAGRLGDEDVVVLNPRVPNDRARLNAAHELGHVLFRDCGKDDGADPEALEKRAFEFASHLLLTRRMLWEAFLGRSMVRLVQFKERYGISLAAMVYRAEAEGVLPKAVAKRLWIEFSRRGWRSREPGHVAEDRATRFEQLLDAAVLNNRLSWQQAASVAGLREDELRERVDNALRTSRPAPQQKKGGQSGPYLRVSK